ncbi:hypothetical protein MY5147_006948 [Beauveria neobassiana]
MFHLTNLHALAVNLDLGIGSTDKANRAIHIVLGQITCAKQVPCGAWSNSRKEATGDTDKRLCSSLLIAQISLSDDGTFNKQFANGTNGGKSLNIIDVGNPQSRPKPTTDGSSILYACYVGICCTHYGAFRRPIGINDAHTLG